MLATPAVLAAPLFCDAMNGHVRKTKYVRTSCAERVVQHNACVPTQ